MPASSFPGRRRGRAEARAEASGLEHGGSLQDRRCGDGIDDLAGPGRRLLEGEGDRLVRCDGGDRTVPGPAIRMVWLGRIGEHPVDASALVQRCVVVHDRAQKRVAEGDPRPQVDESPALGRLVRAGGRDVERRCGPEHRTRIALGLRRGDEEQPPRRRRKRRDLVPGALERRNDPGRRGGQAESTRELLRRHARACEQQAPVPPRLGDDAVTDSLVERSGNGGGSTQRARRRGQTGGERSARVALRGGRSAPGR